MSLKTIDFAKKLEVDNRKALEAELDRVVDDAIQHALACPGHGILVTRLSPGSFTVELSEQVPQGVIAELDLTRRPTRSV
jgi:hypothetical protein